VSPQSSFILAIGRPRDEVRIMLEGTSESQRDRVCGGWGMIQGRIVFQPEKLCNDGSTL